ncbi:MAG: peptidoglycan-binding domain-containing protein [Patiriisocius sp.]|uniref:peptidoglycan-binding domain-containing protein n=1 Tax=Patiriisocius sp. TaxID=2822396 RepID=UPI003EF995BC
MKILIFLLLFIILAILGYNFYDNYQRFHPDNYEYKPLETIDPNHPNKSMLLDYHEAIADLNGYVITQWSANDINVRNPEDDNAQTLAAVAIYTKKKGIVNYFESQLIAPIQEKTQKTKEQLRDEIVKNMYDANPQTLSIGNKGALVFELQRLLNNKGESIKIDGVFNTETFTALKSFEEKNGLYVDGKLDAMTLDYLLQ